MIDTCKQNLLLHQQYQYELTLQQKWFTSSIIILEREFSNSILQLTIEGGEEEDAIITIENALIVACSDCYGYYLQRTLSRQEEEDDNLQSFSDNCRARVYYFSLKEEIS